MKHAGNKRLLKNVESPQVMKLQSLTVLSTINFLIFQNRTYHFCEFLLVQRNSVISGELNVKASIGGR